METKPFSHLFTPFRIGNCRLKNRIVALPVYTGYSHPGGRVSGMMLEHYARLAGSGAAMLVVANAAVSADGVVGKHNLRVDGDEFIPDLSRLAGTIKRLGAVACLQLNHAGRFADTPCLLLPCGVDRSNLAFNVASLRNFMNFFPFEKRFGLTRRFMRRMNRWTRTMTSMERDRVMEAFGAGAIRAREAGFQMVEIHGAGGYLISSFLSGFTNSTPSEIGGDFEARIVYPLRVFRHVRASVGEDFPVGFRLMVQEWVPDGIGPSEAFAFAGRLENEGVAYLSVSAGSYVSYFLPEAKVRMARTAYLKREVKQLTGRIRSPTIISGRIVRPGIAEKLLQDEVADLIGVGRPLRIDARWVKNARDEKKGLLNCINCNSCLKQVVLERGFICSQWPEHVRKGAALQHEMLTRSYRRSLLIVENAADLSLFRQALEALLPDRRNMPMGISPTILVLQPESGTGLDKALCARFCLRVQDALAQFGFSDAVVNESVRVVKGKYEKAVRAEIESGNHGVILMGRNPHQRWRERLLYTVRGKIIALIGKHEQRFHLLVPVDLSDNTLLILMFLNQAYTEKKNFRFHFLHVANGPSKPLMHRWRKQLELAGLDGNFPLDIIPGAGVVAKSVLRVADNLNCGTIIMGKRGGSGVKRWLMGSVSTLVLKNIGDRTLFLVD